MRVLSVASEAYPLIKTGGLADVVGALPAALAPHDVAMTTLLPGYPALAAATRGAKVAHRYDDLLGVEARILRAKIGDHALLVLDAPGLFARGGGPYADPAGADWSDNWRRFAAFSRAAADLGSGVVPGHAFDVLHAHDWQAAMAPAYLRYAPGPGVPAKTVVTIHNIAFQGRYGADIFAELALPDAAFAVDGVEYYGGVGFLKAGLEAADAITTVSPTYAAEIRRGEFGMGLEGLIGARASRVTGIVNGIDADVWNPATDHLIHDNYSAANLKLRTLNKARVASHYRIDQDSGPLFCVISRLTWQKGIDLVAEVVDDVGGFCLRAYGAGKHGLRLSADRSQLTNQAQATPVCGACVKLCGTVSGLEAPCWDLPLRAAPHGVGGPHDGLRRKPSERQI